jgi:uncharacterized protein YycO
MKFLNLFTKPVLVLLLYWIMLILALFSIGRFHFLFDKPIYILIFPIVAFLIIITSIVSTIIFKKWKSLIIIVSVSILSTYGVNLLTEAILDEATLAMYQDSSTNSKNKIGSIQNGDIIFQTSMSSQSKAIQLATNSKYSHMGIIYDNSGSLSVYEAGQSVRLTPLKEWIKRGENEHYVIKRLENADQILSSSTLTKMKRIGERYMGKPYDIYFEWSDDKIYCSELVWKIYKQATGIEIGELKQLADFDLTNDIVKAKINQRYGDNIPMDEKVISPAAMFDSDKLIIVK